MPDVIIQANGLYLKTASGKQVMDWTSGQMSCLLGHGHPEIVETIQAHAAELDHLFTGMVSPPVIQLAKTLTGVLPPGLDKAMFLSTGGESNECAIKLAKCFTGRFEMVGLGASWHGSTSGAAGVQYKAGRQGYGPLVRPSPFPDRQLIAFARCPACTCCPAPTPTARPSAIPTAPTTGAPSSTTAGPSSTPPPAAPSAPLSSSPSSPPAA